MSSAPISLRNIPPTALHIAQSLCHQTHLSMADLLRQALVSGLLVEATRFAPDQEGKLGGQDPAVLARALRRHLSSAIDLLIQYEELPYQGTREPGEKPRQEPNPRMEHPAASGLAEGQQVLFERAIGDDLEMLGLGMSLAQTLEGSETSV